MLNLRINKKSAKFLEKLVPKHFLQIDKKISALRHNPFPSDTAALKGYSDLFRVTAGEYRIIYEILDNTLFINAIGKRNDAEVYKRLSIKQH
jgi:mRNA interferase RelE/StbE